MKKTVFILFFTVVCLAAAAADTVLFCISDNTDQEEPTAWTVSVLRAFEDGVMDAFFDAGHIVTNSFLNECRDIAGKDAENEADVAQIMGSRMGADRVMIMEIIFPEAFSDDLPVPVKARYTMYSNTGKTVFQETETVLEIAEEKGEEELLDSFTEIGIEIASKMISGLQVF